MDIEDFKIAPTKNDLVLIAQRTQLRIVDSCHDEKLYLKDYEGSLEVKHLGDVGLLDKLLLHIPFAEVATHLTEMSQSLAAGERVHVYLVLSANGKTWDWDICSMPIGRDYIEAFLDGGAVIHPHQDESKIAQTAIELIEELESNFERE